MGKFILNFGGLELISLMWIEELGRDDLLLDLGADMPLSKRLDLVRVLVKRSRLEKDLEREVLDTWAAVERLAKIRNDLAHGPIIFGWHEREHSGSPDFVGSLNVRKLRAKDTTATPLVEFQALYDGVDETARLASVLWDLLDRIPKAGSA